MSREYTFAFLGTKADFLSSLNQFKHNTACSGGTFYYFDDYIIKVIGDEIHFGVARGGHSGGYWFVPTITELGDKTEFRGKIRYIGPDENQSSLKKIIEHIGNALMFILFLPIILIVRIYMLVEWLVRKICKRPKPKEKSEEERLFELMENYFGCVEIGDCRKNKR